jgi:tRNA/tmRNA/rRNA uracil-C5-methylase (TrmA/RlmC/RlmD family)
MKNAMLQCLEFNVDTTIILDLLIQTKPKHIIYMSCSTSSLAKDLNKLLPLYKLQNIDIYDMFFGTALVESISHLTLKEKK